MAHKVHCALTKMCFKWIKSPELIDYWEQKQLKISGTIWEYWKETVEVLKTQWKKKSWNIAFDWWACSVFREIDPIFEAWNVLYTIDHLGRWGLYSDTTQLLRVFNWRQKTVCCLYMTLMCQFLNGEMFKLYPHGKIQSIRYQQTNSHRFQLGHG